MTVQMVVAEAGIGYATFFRHFASIDALLMAVSETMIGEIVERIGPALASGDQDALLKAAATYIAEQRRPIAAILIGGGERTRKAITAQAIARAEHVPLVLDPGLPPALAVTHLVGSAIVVVAWWVINGDGHDAERLVEMLRRLALAPVTASEPASR